MLNTRLQYDWNRSQRPAVASTIAFALIFSIALFHCIPLFSATGLNDASGITKVDFTEIVHSKADDDAQLLAGTQKQCSSLSLPALKSAALWATIIVCAAINYYLFCRQQLFNFLGFTLCMGLLSLFLPSAGSQAAAPDWQLTLMPALLAGILYFLCRICEQWVTCTSCHNKRAEQLFRWLKAVAQPVFAVFMLLAILPVSAVALAKATSAILSVAPLALGVVFIANKQSLSTQTFFLITATLTAFAIFALSALTTHFTLSKDLLTVLSGFCIALIALAIALQNRSEISRKNQEHLLELSRLEHSDESLRNSLLKLSSRLKTDKNNHEQMLRLLSHDLRSPIASLQTFASIIIEKNGRIPSDEITEIAHEIHCTCSLQLELLHNLLSLSSGSTLANPPKPHSVDPETMVIRAWSNVANLAQRKQIDLRHTSDTSSHAYIDLNALQTILRNLFTNAIKFSHPHSIVSAHITENTTGGICIKIEDSGIGISENRLKEVFKDELHSTSGTFGEKGIGIGLKLCLDLATANHSTLVLKSSPGLGTTAWLTLPASPDADNKAPAADDFAAMPSPFSPLKEQTKKTSPIGQ